MMPARHLRQVMEAWCGLFSECVPEGEALVTVDRDVMDQAEGMAEEAELNPFSETLEFPTAEGSGGVSFPSLRFPRTKPGSRPSRVVHTLSGRRLILAHIGEPGEGQV